MIKILLSIPIICLTMTSLVNAQITITREDFPEIGTLVISAVDETTPVDPGQPGLDQVWDLSNLVATRYDSAYYLAPEGLPNFEAYPQSNIAVSNKQIILPDMHDVQYLELTTSAYGHAGRENLSPIFEDYYLAYHTKYYPTAYKFAFPFIYDDSYCQIFLMESTFATRQGGTMIDSTLDRLHIDLTVMADASGTMILPEGSFPVIRVKEEVDNIDSVFRWENDQWVLDNTDVYSFVQYYWYADDLGLVGFWDSDGSRANGFSFFISETIVGIEEDPDQAEFTVCPNPASSYIQINSKEKIHRVEILDNTGKILIQSENQPKYDISSLPQGLYIIRILKDNIVSSKKIFKL